MICGALPCSSLGRDVTARAKVNLLLLTVIGATKGWARSVKIPRRCFAWGSRKDFNEVPYEVPYEYLYEYIEYL